MLGRWKINLSVWSMAKIFLLLRQISVSNIVYFAEIKATLSIQCLSLNKKIPSAIWSHRLNRVVFLLPKYKGISAVFFCILLRCCSPQDKQSKQTRREIQQMKCFTRRCSSSSLDKFFICYKWSGHSTKILWSIRT